MILSEYFLCFGWGYGLSLILCFLVLFFYWNIRMLYNNYINWKKSPWEN
jgi:hypothetical protein